MVNQFKCDIDLLTTADSGPRDVSKLLWGVFHTTEDPEGKDPEKTARWQLNPANQSSYNVLFGGDGKTVRSNDDNYSPWAAGMPGNRLGVHGSAVGKAARSRADWFARPAQLESMARWAADLHTRYGFPFRWLTVDQVRGRSAKGFTSHGVYWQAIGRSQGMAYRSDPGGGFPHDWILQRAAEIARGGGSKKQEEKNMQDEYSKDARAQLTGSTALGKYPGWNQLGGLTVVDALGAIGAALDVPGFKDMRDK